MKEFVVSRVVFDFYLNLDVQYQRITLYLTLDIQTESKE